MFTPNPDYRPGFLRVLGRLTTTLVVLAGFGVLDYWVFTEYILFP